MVTIHFEDDCKTIEVEENQNLCDICDAYSTSLLFGCREASCGTCLIEVVSGFENISSIASEEEDMLAVLAPDISNARLACQCVVLGNISIRNLKG